MNIHGTIIFFIVIALSCSSIDNKRLEWALALAGENRKEFEKVLSYYQFDAEKLAAARFLIENMPGKYSKKGAYQDSVKQLLSVSLKNGQTMDILFILRQNIHTKQVSVYVMDYVLWVSPLCVQSASL